ncbi:MAG: lysophospholipid acyltransferase family protein [Hyphomicrobiales bacterium]
MKLFSPLVASGIILFARFITAVRGIWQDPQAGGQQTVYFANHTSNGDFVLIWTLLPAHVRNKTRPVAAADYWLTSTIRRFIGKDVFNAVLIERKPEDRTEDPVTQMSNALDEGSSLIIFPEGLRNLTDQALLPFKSGLYHLAKAKPNVPLTPAWIENLNRVMPKGEIIPIPLVCTVTFGTPLHVEDGEDKAAFLKRAEKALLDLNPSKDKPVGEEQ